MGILSRIRAGSGWGVRHEWRSRTHAAATSPHTLHPTLFPPVAQAQQSSIGELLRTTSRLSREKCAANTMSVTTTSNSRYNAVREVLQDYDLHHSNTQPSDAEAAPAPPPNAEHQVTASNPPGWEDRWRRVPAYRPMQNQLDDQRETYNGEVERTFIRTMFGGERKILAKQ